MAKQYNIRWNPNEPEQLRKAVRNFNAKVKRLEAKYEGVSGVVIPEKVSYKEMRKLIGTRGDLQRELKSLQSFTQRGSEELVRANTEDTIYLTKWQNKELKARAKRINKSRAERRDFLENQELIHKGEGLGYTRGAVGMGKTDALMLRPTSAFTPKMRKYEINEKMKHYRNESQSLYWKRRDALMVENYKKALTNSFNSRADDIKAKIDSMSIDEAKDIILSDPQEFNTAYPLTKDELNDYLKRLRIMWGLPEAKPEAKPKAKSKGKKSKSKKKSKKRK